MLSEELSCLSRMNVLFLLSVLWVVGVVLSVPIESEIKSRRKIKMFVVEVSTQDPGKVVETPLPFGKRRASWSEEQEESVKEGRREQVRIGGGGLGRGFQRRMGQASPVNATANALEAEKKRAGKQKDLFDNMTKLGLSEPPQITLISPEADIYSHVRWYKNYLQDTRISEDPGTLNPLELELFGMCGSSSGTLDPSALFHYGTDDEVVEFYVTYMKEECLREALESYKSFLTLGYLTVGPTKALSVVPGTQLLTAQSLTTADLTALVRMLRLAAYSEVFSSAVNNPTGAVGPSGRSLSWRVFVLVNTVLHILDLIVTYGVEHYTMVVRSLFKQMMVMGRGVYCRYATSDDGDGRRGRFKDDALAVTVLMEYLSKCSRRPGECAGDAHGGFQEMFLDQKLGLVQKYTGKVEGLLLRSSFKRTCSTMFSKV